MMPVPSRTRLLLPASHEVGVAESLHQAYELNAIPTPAFRVKDPIGGPSQVVRVHPPDFDREPHRRLRNTPAKSGAVFHLKSPGRSSDGSVTPGQPSGQPPPKRGGRFSKNARIPSRASPERKSRFWARYS